MSSVTDYSAWEDRYPSSGRCTITAEPDGTMRWTLVARVPVVVARFAQSATSVNKTLVVKATNDGEFFLSIGED